MEKLLEKGFRVVNSFYPYTYTDCGHYISSEKTKTWHPARLALEAAPQISETPTKHPDRILGGEGCAWEYGHYESFFFLGYVVPPVLAMLGDKMWDQRDREHTQAYREALSEYLFGTDAFTCVFDAIGDFLPRRKTTEFIAKGAKMPSVDTVQACLAKLEAITHKACLTTAKQYVGLFEKILEQSKGGASV